MTRTPTTNSTIALQVLVLGAIWGSAFTLIKVLVDELSPVEIAAGRLALGAAAIVAFQAARRSLRLPEPALVVPIAVVAVLDTVAPYLLVGWAEGRIDSGAASVLISSMPLFTVVFATAVRQERAGVGQIAGVAIGFGGVIALFGSPGALVHSGARGEIAVIGAAATYAAGGLYARRLLRRIDATNFTAAKLSLGALMASAVAAGAGQGAPLFALDPRALAALVTLGVVCTGLSFVLYFRIVALAGSITGSTVTYVIPVFGLLFGAAILGESIAPRTLAGMALIAAGVAAVMYAPALDAGIHAMRVRGAPLGST
jgi:drug/metabolite transporter (DMT)-like permease